MNIDTNNLMQKARYTGKMIVVGVLVIVCWVTSLFVLGLVSEREGRQVEVSNQIAEEWGRPQLVAGPVLVVPFTRLERNPIGVLENTRKNLYILPKTLEIDNQISPELRKRGIFHTPVYRDVVHMSGTFIAPDLTELGITQGSLLVKEAELVVGLSDTRNIVAKEATWNDVAISLAPGSGPWSVNGMGIHAKLPSLSSLSSFWSATVKEQDFNLELSFTGSRGVSFLPLGDNTQITAGAPWPSPSFAGAYLPTSESLEEDNFPATWQISSLGRSYPSAWEGSVDGIKLNSGDYGNDYGGGLFAPTPTPTTRSLYVNPGSGQNYEQALASSAFGVDLFSSVTFYTLVSRTVKYAILFIALTFLAFYLFEVISGLRIHPFQYLLVGAGLVIFYLLLLSFSEHIGFGLSYLLSCIMTLGLITSYSASVLKARGRSWIIAGILTILYTYLYAVLQLENYALLFGTLFLFIALAAVMYVTRKLNWYGAEAGE